MTRILSAHRHVVFCFLSFYRHKGSSSTEQTELCFSKCNTLDRISAVKNIGSFGRSRRFVKTHSRTPAGVKTKPLTVPTAVAKTSEVGIIMIISNLTFSRKLRFGFLLASFLFLFFVLFKGAPTISIERQISDARQSKMFLSMLLLW